MNKHYYLILKISIGSNVNDLWCLFLGDFCLGRNNRPLPVLKKDGAAQEG